MKRAITITTILIVFVALFAGAWWYLMRGETTVTATTDDSTGRIFNPFGMFGGDADTPRDTAGDNVFPDVPSGNVQGQQALVRISEKPTAGATTLIVQNGTSTDYTVRYVERETGHVYDYDIATAQNVRISNTTIPRVREALFGNNGATIAFRRIPDDGETVETYLGTIASSTATSTSSESRLSGLFLPQNILSLTIHPTQNQTFYIMRTDVGATGYVLSRTGTQSIFSHPFYQWHSSWNDGSIVLTTAPSRGVGGIAFGLNPNNGAFERISSTTLALTALPYRDGKTLLYSTVGPSGLRIFVHDRNTRQAVPLSVATLPEKCVWSSATLLYCAIPNNTAQNLPDDWYQGAISFTDTLWQIDTQTGLTTYLLDPATVITGGVDMVTLSLSQNNTHLAFINKKDGSLWLVDLSRTLTATQSSF